MKVKEGNGYSTTTYKIRLYSKHLDWIEQTKNLYNDVLQFYYNLLFNDKTFLKLSNQELMRRLEQITIGEKSKNIAPIFPLPYKKIPLYFRRAAINGAISMVRSHVTRESVYPNCKIGRPKKFNTSPVYYKGMYKEFEKSSIILKLWTGTSWVWVKYHFNTMGRDFPEQAVLLSPTLKLNQGQAILHVPVKSSVKDIRTVKLRIQDKEKYCSVSFPNSSSLAVCALFDSDGRFCHTYFIKGGKELKHRRKYYQMLIDKKNTKKGRWAKEKLHHLTDYYAHRVSREIVKFCQKNQAKIIVVPQYRQELNLNHKGYIEATNYDWIGRRIIQYINYKAFREGIVTCTVKPHFSSSSCCRCGNEIRRYNDGHIPSKNYYGGKLFLCNNGHKGNTALNTARNLGNFFYQRYIKNEVS